LTTAFCLGFAVVGRAVALPLGWQRQVAAAVVELEG